MIADRIQGKWIDLFAEVFARCKVASGDICAVLSESQSRALNVQLAEFALARLFRHCTVELDGKAVVKDGKLAA